MAANRDEFLARPAEGLAIRTRQTGPVLSPLDLEAGGSWLGLNARGVFVGLTNLRTPTIRENENEAISSAQSQALRSRGEVVMAALEEPTARAAAARIERLDEGVFNPFQLVIADREHASLTVYQGRPQTNALLPGVHIVGNVLPEPSEDGIGPGEDGFGLDGLANDGREQDGRQAGIRKLTRIRERVEKMLVEPNRDPLEALSELCREHVGAEASPFESTCVHLKQLYGTRSSFLLELAEGHKADRLWATDGPPCAGPFEDKSFLLRELGASAPLARRATA